MVQLRFLITFFILLGYSAAWGEAPTLAMTIHQEVVNDIQFNKTYYKSGCFVRAHWIANRIHQNSYLPVKVFIETSAPEARMKVKLLNGITSSWKFHVAAGFRDQLDQIWLIDPVLFNQPVKLEQWITSLQKRNLDLVLAFKVTGAEIYHVDADVEREFAGLGFHFSEKVMDFIKDGMEDLFIWESHKI